MREIKFRARRTDNGDFCCGSIILMIDPTKEITSYYKAFIYGGVNISLAISVDIETVGEFTGILDKNGIEIFEGDLIKDLISGKILEVKFGQSGLGDRYTGWYAEGEGRQYRINNDSDNDKNISIELAGTIYENQELLKP